MTSTRPPKQAAAQPASARPRDPSAVAAHGPLAREPQLFGNQAALRTLDSEGDPGSHGHWAAAQSLLGNQGVLRRLQTKLAINQPGDQYEQEADRVADHVMRMPHPSAVATTVPAVQRKCSCGGSCEKCQAQPGHEQIQMKRVGSGEIGQTAAPPIVHEVLRSPGQPLDPATRTFMEPRFGLDFSGVRVHTDGEAAEAVRAVQARAFTVGRDIAFGSGEYAPASVEGKRLLAHELMHVAQSRQTVAPNVVRRKILPADVSSELVGQQFTVRKEFIVGGVTLPAGGIVTVASWSNTADTAEVSHLSVAGTFNIPKVLLEPVQTKVSGIAPYGAGLAKVEQDVERGAAEIEKFKKTEPQYKTARAKRAFAKDLNDLTVPQASRVTHLNERLIQASMLNRFDASIKRWVDFYNSQFGFKGDEALDPNLIKAMMYKESAMGTNEEHMSDPPTHPVMTRFNVLQAVDSWPEEQLLVIKEMAPALLPKYHLENVEKDLITVETEFDCLKARKTRKAKRGCKKEKLTTVEEARLATLTAQAGQGENWQDWFRAYPGFEAAVTEFLETMDGGKKHSEDYDFWIRVGIRAVFEKRKQVKSWEEAARAYNGVGKDARDYRDFAVRHVKGAVKAEKEGREFIPEKL